MTQEFPILGRVRPEVVALATSAVMILAASGAAYAQGHGRHSMPSSGGDPSSGAGSGQGSRSGRSSGGTQTTQAAPAPPTHVGRDRSSRDDSDRSGHAVQRDGGDSGITGRSGERHGTVVTRDNSGDASGSGSRSAPPDSRPRDGRNATGEAVRRPPRSTGGGTTVIVTGGGYQGGFYPWGYGGLGFGGYYGAGYYDPFWDDGYGSGYEYGYDGALRLKVKPREASVYVDGYFAGSVDDFDGVFQRLRIESGPHRVELRLDEYEPLTFEVRIQPDRTVTYTGELKRIP